MNLLVYGLLLTIFSVDFATTTFSLPRMITWLPEVMAALIGAVAVGHFAWFRPAIPGKYLVWAGYMVLIIVAGLILNQVQPGAVFSGLRKYFRYAPIFILPLIYTFSEQELRGQLRLLLALAALQLPVAVYQRLVDYAVLPTGDVVQGTVMGSGALSIFLICTLAMLTAFYATGRMRLTTYVFLGIVCFLPTTINETTATLVLLPVAIAAPFLLSIRAGTRLSKLLPLSAIAAAMIAAFTISYAAQFDRWGGDVTSVLTGQGVEFLYRGADEQSRAGDGIGMKEIGRWDSVMMPFLHIDDYTKLAVGVGIGNASASFSRVLQGEFSEQVDTLGIDFTTASQLIWEVGLLGFGMSILLLYMVFRDALALRTRPDLAGSYALGAAAICVLVGATLFYTGIVSHTVLGYSMWLVFGHVVALRARLVSSLTVDVERHAVSA